LNDGWYSGWGPVRGRPPVVPELDLAFSEIALVESRLKPAGAEYTILHCSPLQRAEQLREKET